MSTEPILDAVRMPDGRLRVLAFQPEALILGCTVLFTPASGATHNGATECVAIIGQVLGDGPRPYCNLWVMPPFAQPSWVGPVQEYDPAGLRNGTWRWPPR
jgi:hypothetical protein